MQSDNESDLLPVLRRLTDNKYLTVNSVISSLGQKINKVFRVFEEDGGEGDIGTGNPGAGVNVTTPDGTNANDIGTLPVKFEKGKIIKADSPKNIFFVKKQMLCFDKFIDQNL